MYAKINEEKKYLGRIVKQYMPTEKVPRTGTGSFYRMKDGRIAMLFSRVYGTGADHDTNDIMVCFSYDEGETFTEPEILMTCEDCNAIFTGCISLLTMQDGSIGIFYLKREKGNELVSDKEMASMVCLRTTTDFKTLSKERILISEGVYYVMNAQRIVRLKNGNIVVPLAYFHWRDVTEEEAGLYPNREVIYDPCTCFCFVSEDDGKTFKKSEEIAIIMDEGLLHEGLQEPGVQELDDGRLYFYARTSLGRHYQSYSSDGGLTWSTPCPSKFTGPLSPLDMYRMSNGKFAIVYNPKPWYPGGTNSTWVGRTPFVFRVGDGNLKNISDAYLLDDHPNGAYHYSTFIETSDSLLISYMAGGENGWKRLSNMRIRKISKSEIDELK